MKRKMQSENRMGEEGGKSQNENNEDDVGETSRERTRGI